MSVSDIDPVVIVRAQHELTLLFEYYPQAMVEGECLETFRDLLKDLSSEEQDDRVSAVLNKAISQYLGIPLSRYWGMVAFEMGNIVKMIDEVCKGDERASKHLMELIEFCNAFFKQLEAARSRTGSFGAHVVPV